MIQDFKVEIIICFSSLIIKHWTPVHQTSHVFPHSFIELSRFCNAESPNSMSFKTRQKKMCEDLILFDFLSVHS
jgi:hypothetical protein